MKSCVIKLYHSPFHMLTASLLVLQNITLFENSVMFSMRSSGQPSLSNMTGKVTMCGICMQDMQRGKRVKENRKARVIYRVKTTFVVESLLLALIRNYSANNSMSAFWIYEKIDPCLCHQVAVAIATIWLEAATPSQPLGVRLLRIYNPPPFCKQTYVSCIWSKSSDLSEHIQQDLKSKLEKTPD